MKNHRKGIAFLIIGILLFANVSTISTVIQQMNHTTIKRNTSIVYQNK